MASQCGKPSIPWGPCNLKLLAKFRERGCVKIQKRQTPSMSDIARFVLGLIKNPDFLAAILGRFAKPSMAAENQGFLSIGQLAGEGLGVFSVRQ